VAVSEHDDAAGLVDRAILDLRVLRLSPALRGERREAVEAELEALRLARLGVRVKGQAAYLARCGVVSGRRRGLRRGPREWGGKTAVRLVR
jgi:hypothetical protein